MPKKPLVGLSDSFWAPLPSDAPAVPTSPSALCPHVTRPCPGASPTLDRSSSPSPGLSSQVTPRGLGQRLFHPHAYSRLPVGTSPSSRASPCYGHSSPLPTSLVEVSSRAAAGQAGEFGSPHPRPGPPIPSRPSLTGRRLGGRRWHRRARAAAVDDVVGNARVLGDAEHIVPGAGA